MFTPTTVQVDGEKLRKLRHERVMSIGDLSRESGLHRNVISKLEKRPGWGVSREHPQDRRRP